MGKHILKSIMISMVIISTIVLIIGCDNKSTEDPKKEGKAEGFITALGSTALQPLVEETSKNFTKKNPDAVINVQGGGSGAGINQVIEGSIEIGNSDIEARKKLKEKKYLDTLVDHKICVIGFAIIINKDVSVDSLTKEEIQDIFTGKITNWNEVGGKNEAINIINRPKSSGARITFKDKIMDGKEEKNALGIIQDSSGGVLKAVNATKGSISYLPLSNITEYVKVIKLNKVEATKENIKASKYPFWSYEHMYTKREPDILTKTFLDYMVSDENKKLIEKLGYISVSD